MPNVYTESIVARGDGVALRVWRDEEPTDDKPEETRPYETLGYVVAGKVELTVAGKTVSLGPGDAYTVPKNAPHRYVVRERLTAVEAISPVS
jgi:quercetin dioxygenase-like cupin family protein